MDIIITIGSVLILGFILNAILKLAYNLIFFIGRKPILWITCISFVSIAIWAMGSAFDWSVSIPAWACTIALIMNWPPKQKPLDTQLTASEIADEMYREMGIPRGRLLYRLGLVSFLITSLASWILFYGESCAGGECQNLLESLL